MIRIGFEKVPLKGSFKGSIMDLQVKVTIIGIYSK